MRTLVVILVLALASLYCVGCSTSSGAPSCSDESVKRLVLDISTRELRNQLLDGRVPITVEGPPLPSSYDDLNKMKNDSTSPHQELIRKLIATVDQQISEAKISLANIRINGKRDDIKKCECGGDLAFSDGKTHPINYTAQFTEDGKVYVEVTGLK